MDRSERDGDSNIRAAEVVLPCDELGPCLAFFERLGFRLEAIGPADDPSTALLDGHGLRIRLERGRGASPGPLLRLACRDAAALAADRQLIAPNGTRIELVDADPPLALPPLAPSLVITAAGDDSWREGRAGMLYRDLIPDRQGGRFIASHIRIPEGGAVPDYVHHHRIHFQLIYCYRGWVRVVYEDQGPPFVLDPGDCVLQPPHIRHRVLESSPGLEVIEVSSPAAHDTLADHELTLPTARRERQYGGQRFVHHRAAAAAWTPWHSGLVARDLGIAAATGGIASAHVARPDAVATAALLRHRGELRFLFVLAGAITLDCDGGRRLATGDAAVVPAGLDHTFVDPSANFELLEIDLPAISQKLAAMPVR
jgi:quercetin dioxygenase-like cupin family protein